MELIGHLSHRVVALGDHEYGKLTADLRSFWDEGFQWHASMAVWRANACRADDAHRRWSPTVKDRRTAPLHLMSWTRPASVARLVMQGAAEVRILALHRSKRDHAGRLSFRAAAAAGLRDEELLALMR